MSVACGSVLAAALVAPLAAEPPLPSSTNRERGNLPTGLTAEQALIEVHQASGLNIISDAGFGQVSVDPRAPAGRDALQSVAEGLDCRVVATHAHANLVVLRRRFRSPAEMPQANLGELRQCANDMLRGLRAFDYPEGPPTESWSPVLKTLARSLTAEQAAALERGQEIEISNLAPAQQRLAEQAMLSRAFGGLKHDWELLAARLAVLDHGVFRARAITTGQPPLYQPRLELPGLNTGSPVTFYPFPPDVTVERKAGDSSAGSSAAQGHSTLGVQTGPAAPLAPGRIAGLDAEVAPPAGLTTVGGLAAELTSQTRVPIEPRAALDGRRLIVAVSGIHLRDLLDALASLYDWRWYRSDDGKIVIEKPLPPLPRRPADMGAFLRAVLPVDLRAFYAIRSIPDPHALAKPTADQDGPDSVPGVPAFGQRTQEAAHRGLAAIARGFAAAGGPEAAVPFTQLSARDQEAVMLMLVASTFRTDDVEVWLDEPLAVPVAGADVRLTLKRMKDRSGESNGAALMIYNVRGNLRAGFGTDVP